MLEDSPTPTTTTIRTRYRPPVSRRFVGKSAPGATRVVKKSAAARQREILESYDSDSGLELTEFEVANPFLVTDVSAKLPTARSTSNVSSSSSSSSSVTSGSMAPTSATHFQQTVKQEELDSVAPFLIPAKRITKKPRWPADFFAINIANFFDEIEDNASDARVCSLFEPHFGQWVAYKRSTYYDHRQRWQEATLDAKQTVLSAGQTEAGCWWNLMSTTPAPRAHIQALRRRNTSQVMTVKSDIIELSSDMDSD